jgi:hypothetical protein
MTRHFCTYFDSVYLPRGLALYRSMLTHAGSFRLWVLCLDDEAHRILAALSYPEIVPIRLEEVERGDQELLQARGNRSQVEYYFTLTPSLPRWILKTAPEVEMVSYVDADLFLFSDAAPLFDELGAGSVMIIEHRFPPRLQARGCNNVGRFNVGWLTFRRDAEGLACLERWRDQCIEWCYDREEDGKFADQKYLDDWPGLYRSLVILQHPGGNLAPWNVENYRIRAVDDGRVTVDGRPLVFYHFQGLKHLYGPLYESGFGHYKTRLPRAVRRGIYRPYLKALHDVMDEVRGRTGYDAAAGTKRLRQRPTCWLKIKGMLEFLRDVVFRRTFVIYQPPRRGING